MKKIFLLPALLAAGLFAVSCSSSEEDEAQSTSILDKFDVYGNAQVGFTIATASSTTTRANGENSENDYFQYGDDDEYKINDAILVTFAGSNEADARFVDAYPLQSLKSTGISGTDVSDVYIANIKNKGLEISDKLYALIVANAGSTSNGILTETSGTWKLETTNLVKGASGTKFSEFQKVQLSELGNQTKGMVMFNAPLSSMNNTKTSSAPTEAAVTTLVEITSSNITDTEASAKENAIKVFVERAAAKVQVKKASTLDKTKPATFADEILWIADNLEPKYYAVRVVSEENGSNKNSTSAKYREYSSENLSASTYSWRFFSAEKEFGADELYRNYWAIDPNYHYTAVSTESTTALVGSQVSASDFNEATKRYSADDGYQYITENTMNEYGLTKDRTTRVVLRLTFNDNKDFYTINGGDNVYKQGASNVDGTLAKKVLEYVLSLKKVQDEGFTSGNVTVTVDPAKKTTSGAVGASEIGESGKFINIATSASGKQSALETAYGDLANDLNITAYIGGYAYYQVRIKHFGDFHTPLATTPAGSDYNGLYGISTTSTADEVTKAAKNFLGRYGVVRNNWYIINVTAVKHIGSATIPTPDYTPDDDNDQYLATEIYVAKWAQRTQNAELY